MLVASVRLFSDRENYFYNHTTLSTAVHDRVNTLMQGTNIQLILKLPTTGLRKTWEVNGLPNKSLCVVLQNTVYQKESFSSKESDTKIM